jgi:hypothetical protein
MTGMHIDLSTEPPTCESCILGKQTKSSVPKIQEGRKLDRQLGIVYVDLMRPQTVQLSAGNL